MAVGAVIKLSGVPPRSFCLVAGHGPLLGRVGASPPEPPESI